MEADAALPSCESTSQVARSPRRLIPGRDDALPLYVQSAGARVGKTGEELVIELRDGTKTTVQTGNTSHLALYERCKSRPRRSMTSARGESRISYLSAGGWLKAITRGMDHKNVELRRQQFSTASDEARCLALARRFVSVKIRNCRTMIRRNGVNVPPHTLARLRELIDVAGRASSLASLLGIEGTAARLYFESYGLMLRPPDDADRFAFDFDGRNRRPPRDPINALLSFGYALLVRDMSVTLTAVGFDPLMGFYHQPRYGRPALALDVMEEFRPLIVCSVVLGAVNTGAVGASSFPPARWRRRPHDAGPNRLPARLRAPDGRARLAPRVWLSHQLPPGAGGAGPPPRAPPGRGNPGVPALRDAVTRAAPPAVHHAFDP